MPIPSDPDRGDAEQPKAAGLNVSTHEATAITPTAALKDEVIVGSKWGHLRLLEEVGRGAFGRVFRAWDSTLAREVALKILRLETADEAALSAVLREGQMLARIRHRHVVTVYGAQQIGRDVGVWMELVQGRTLAQMVREDGPLGPEEAAIVGMTLCDALAAVHSAGLLHRDIKAQNVMRESGGRIVLMDFGAGLELIERRRHADLVGTPLYMSPAVLAGAAWSPSADLYSVGVLLFYLVSGRFPVEGQSMAEIATAHALGDQRALTDVRPGLPEGFSRVVRRALSSRYRTAGAMMRDLAEAIPGQTAVSEAALATEASPRTPAVLMTPSPATTTGPVAATRIVEKAALVLGAVVGIWLLGTLTSLAFDHSLRRIPGFSQESQLDVFRWGVRALVGPASYVLIGWVVARMLHGLWRLVVRFVPPVTRGTLWMRRRWREVAPRIGFGDVGRVAQWVLAGQIAMVGLIAWAFRDLIDAFTRFLDVAPASSLALLSQSNDAVLVYRMALSFAVLAMLMAWRALLRSDAAAVDRPTMFAGYSVIALTVVMIVIPFRLIHHSRFPVADYEGQRCYVIGERGTELQLFCPNIVPRSVVVTAADPRLGRRGAPEAIFGESSVADR